ncbi:MAG: methyltransferase [Methylococcaceae bacterium]|jgi:16S rRNA (guanine1207-N2)-methyltransferase
MSSDSLASQILSVPQGRFQLQRLPKRPRELLQAWDAADEYLLAYADTMLTASAINNVLIVNDSFGALAIALNAYKPEVWSDSYLSQQATQLNLAGNDISELNIRCINSLEVPTKSMQWVFIKVPKTLALLEDQLIKLQPFLTASTQIVVAGMVKLMPSSIWKLIGRIIGETTTSLAQKKARLIFAKPNIKASYLPNPYPIRYQLEETEFTIVNHANVFSRDSLDIGTRFFLQHLPINANARTIVDLGCGNGVLGLMAAVKNLQAELHFVDESFMAVASARENFYQAFGASRSVSFHVANGLESFIEETVDLILCNPPFHQQNAIGDHIAHSFFKESLRVLSRQGQLWVVGNRHLNYQQQLSKLFNKTRIVAVNAKFIIWQAGCQQ